jgi:hypothetical protein
LRNQEQPRNQTELSKPDFQSREFYTAFGFTRVKSGWSGSRLWLVGAEVKDLSRVQGGAGIASPMPSTLNHYIFTPVKTAAIASRPSGDGSGVVFSF